MGEELRREVVIDVKRTSKMHKDSTNDLLHRRRYEL